ncbi:histidine phosphatase family protein [Nonomuraea jiangxiensis]|uniref:Alpha-ribazole phosphatase/probable phosphoglycerate mutase n=1 Tax=Nonomuraea jiangxiensis TaxID=633440 RepID=A0A1G8FKY2_9ACTN|nr:histidine phosphatase family protein [Nonomuraea jiangxiensis]SDH82768.1 alpha-ribazole phosphatase/probable phosphoglycerate mutase [Nonomuraea jiangxiensis]
MSDHVRLLCLRHAESANAVSSATGALPLAQLTGRGRVQAGQAARRLIGEGITRVYAGAAVPPRQTAQIIARTIGLDGVATLPELAEFGIGGLEGTSDPAVRARATEVLRSWVVDGKLDEAVGDGEDGHAVTARVVDALTSIAAAHPGETVAVVGHIGSLTVGLSALCGLGGRVWGAPLPHAVPFEVEWDGDAWRCETWPG